MGAGAIDAGGAAGAVGGGRVTDRPPDAIPGGGEGFQPVVDPTNRLLSQVADVSHFPWIPMGVAILLVLWFVSMPRLVQPLASAETGWMAEAFRPASASVGTSARARSRTRAVRTWEGVTPDESRPLSQSQRIAVRLPSAVTGAASLLIFFLLARLVAGDAAALLGACLLAIAGPWVEAGTSTLPLLAGETLVLLGVTWAIVLHGRHREVQIAAVNALRIGVAGAFLGIGLLLAPATFASFLTTLLLWFVLGLRRSSSDATTLPVESPRRTVALAILGTVMLVGATVFASAVAERLAGGGLGARWPSAADLVPEASLWLDLHRQLLSPGPHTDLLLLVALVVIAVVRGVERWGGRPWKAAGLLPWTFLGLYFRIAGGEARAAAATAGAPSSLVVPITVGPLVILGLAWIVLRGLQPGRVRRQEYGFAVTWLLASALLVPFVPGGHPYAPALAAAISVLPPLLLVAGRGARSLWHSSEAWPGRVAILAIAYLPIALFGANALNRVLEAPAALNTSLDRIGELTPTILLFLAALGALSVILTVRPDTRVAVFDPERPRGRRGRRGGRPGRRGRRTGRRPEGPPRR